MVGNPSGNWISFGSFLQLANRNTKTTRVRCVLLFFMLISSVNFHLNQYRIILSIHVADHGLHMGVQIFLIGIVFKKGCRRYKHQFVLPCKSRRLIKNAVLILGENPPADGVILLIHYYLMVFDSFIILDVDFKESVAVIFIILVNIRKPR